MSKNHSSIISDDLLDLLIQRSTVGLTDKENQELRQMIDASTNRERLLEEIDRLDLTATAIGLTDPAILKSTFEKTDPLSADKTLPASLRDTILVDAGKHFSEASKDSAVGNSTAATQTQLPDQTKRESISSGLTLRESLAMMAAAASIIVLLSGYNPFAKPVAPVVDVTDQESPPENQLVLVTPPLGKELDEFLKSKPADLVRLDWTPVHALNVTGEVFWSDELNQGYMVFTGLKANDTDLMRYQLWIFDTDPQQSFPVDGGLFDIKNSKERTVVAIDANVLVKKAVQFAVTEEIPGGVVVSKREKIPVLAALPL